MKRPIGYSLLGLYIALGTLWASGQFALFATGPWPLRVLGVVLVALAAVSVEALWAVRPWCTRAVAAFFAAILLYLVASLTHEPRGLDLGVFFGVAAVMVAILAYVHDRAARIFGARPVRARIGLR